MTTSDIANVALIIIGAISAIVSAIKIKKRCIKILVVAVIILIVVVAVILITAIVSPPEPRIDDTFSGTVIDSSKWRPTALVSQNEKLIMSLDGKNIKKDDGTEGGPWASVTSNWYFTDDFEVEVDYELGAGWEKPENGSIMLALFVNTGGFEYGIRRCFDSDGTDSLAVHGQEGQLNDSLSGTKTGKFKLIKQDNIITSLINIGSGWIKYGRVECPQGYTSVTLACWENVGTAKVITCYFDNFKVISGNDTY